MVVVMVAVIYAIVYRSARSPQCAGHVSWPACRQPHVHAGQRHIAVDGKPGRHDPAHFCQCHPAVPGHYCQLLCQFNECSGGKICYIYQATFNGGWIYYLLYFLMVVSFTFFYTDVMFTQQNYGENLKKSARRSRASTVGPRPRNI